MDRRSGALGHQCKKHEKGGEIDDWLFSVTADEKEGTETNSENRSYRM